MGALGAGGVTVLETWSEVLSNGDVLYTKRISLTLGDTGGGFGTVANYIPASMMGFTQIIRSSPLVKTDNSATIVAAGPSTDGTILLLNGGDQLGTWRCVVEGI